MNAAAKRPRHNKTIDDSSRRRRLSAVTANANRCRRRINNPNDHLNCLKTVQFSAKYDAEILLKRIIHDAESRTSSKAREDIHQRATHNRGLVHTSDKQVNTSTIERHTQSGEIQGFI